LKEKKGKGAVSCGKQQEEEETGRVETVTQLA
jgi:hypothetical protein